MSRMTGPDCAVKCNLINTHEHTHNTIIIYTVIIVPTNLITTEGLYHIYIQYVFVFHTTCLKLLLFQRLQRQNLFMAFKRVPRRR